MGHSVSIVNKRIPVIAGSGANSTSEAMELTLKSKELGADGCLLVTPYYNKHPQNVLYHHYKTIADKVAEFSINNFIENKNAIIFYEKNYQDSLIAEIYNNKLESNGFNIIYKKSVGLEDSRLILDSLASTYEYILNDSLFDTLRNVSDVLIKEGRGIEDLDTSYMYTQKFFIENDSIGHVFVSSKNSLFASNIISAIEIREDTIPILGFSR